MRTVNISDKTRIHILKGVVAVAGITCAFNAIQIQVMERRFNNLRSNALFAAKVIDKFVDLAPGAAEEIHKEFEFEWVVKDLGDLKDLKD